MVKTFKTKTLLAMFSVATMLAMLTGCTAAPVAKNVVKEPKASPVAECDTSNEDQWGDVTAKELITDEYGSYCHTTIHPDAEALKFDAAKTDMDAITERGFTQADGEAVQKAVAVYLAEVALDSTFLDTYTVENDAKWAEANKNRFSDRTYNTLIEGLEDDPATINAVVIASSMPGPMKRDNSPRANSTSIKFMGLTASTDENHGEYLQATFTAIVEYDVEEAKLVEAILANNSTIGLEQLQASNPELFDKVEDNKMTLSASFGAAYKPDDINKLIGCKLQWYAVTETGREVIPLDGNK